MTDEEFLKAFEDCTLEEFHHKDHIRMAWIYLRKFGYEIGSAKVKEGIKKFAAAKNATTLYHETITQFWIYLVQHVITSNPQTGTFEQFFFIFPPLRDAKSIFLHYSKDFLMTEVARKNWRNPDLLRMPGI
jgi:hypothetical protein